MSVLCAGDTHVFQVGSTACDCGMWGAAAVTNSHSTTGGVIPGYTPKSYPASGGIFPGYHPPGYTPPPAGQAPPVSIAVFRAAQLAGASHLSADGLRIYTVRYGETLEAEWKERLRDFGAWSVVDGLPPDAVKM